MEEVKKEKKKFDIQETKKQVIQVIDENGNGQIDIEDIIIKGLKTPGIRINREKFLRKELMKKYSKDTIDNAVATNPIQANITIDELDKVANDVINFENELDTNITFEQVQGGIQFEINKGNKLCGQFVIDVSEVVDEEKNIYLFNEAKQKYEKIAVEDINLLTIDTAGTYLLTTESLDGFTWNKLGVSVGVGALIIGMIAYIVVKKQYWFW